MKRVLLILAGMTCLATAQAAPADRSGKEIVDQVCGPSCHFTGKKNAPKISDREAWAERARKGMPIMTETAIRGVREMPAHGGKASVSDLELSRAINYMLTGNDNAKIDVPYASPVSMSGKELVEVRCKECHGSGKDGAPRIGNMQDWAPRLAGGMDAMIRNAITGHKKMPARAGMASLSDQELKLAAQHMFTTAAQ